MLDTANTSADQADASEEVDAVVVDPARPLPARRSPTELVATQAAVVGGSFVAGALAVVVVSRRRNRKAARRGKRSRAANIAASRSFLVDVHLLQR